MLLACLQLVKLLLMCVTLAMRVTQENNCVHCTTGGCKLHNGCAGIKWKILEAEKIVHQKYLRIALKSN